MSTSVLHRIDQIRFDMPLSVLLGASTAFAVFAAPNGIFGLLPGSATVPFGQGLVGLVAGGALGAGAFLTMKLAGTMSPAIWEPDLAVEEDDAIEEPAAPEPVFKVAEVPEAEPKTKRVRFRRADRHPDAPTREPIRASRDLGQPFMDVGKAPAAPVAGDEDEEDHDSVAFVPWFQRAAAATEAAAPETPTPETPMAETPKAQPGATTAHPLDSDDDFELDAPDFGAGRTGEPWLVPAEEPEYDLAHSEPEAFDMPPAHDEIDAPIAAFAPAEEPVPAPARVARPSISALMERLSAGAERRGEAPSRFSPDEVAQAYGAPRAGAEDLRKALDELNRLAARRG